MEVNTGAFWTKNVTEVLYISSSAHKTLVVIYIFNVFNDKKLKKKKQARNLQQNLTKKCFLSLRQNAGWVFYSQINKILYHIKTNCWIVNINYLEAINFELKMNIALIFDLKSRDK